MPVEPLVFNVHGVPVPQGSKVSRGGRVLDANPRARRWRADVVAASRSTRDGQATALVGPVEVTADFRFIRPITVRGMRGTVPISRSTGDLDKLLRAVLDALALANIYRDDSQVVSVRATKSYVESPATPGVAISVREAAMPHV